MNTIDKEFIAKTEASHFRTNSDTGANECAMLVWNMVRQHVGLPRLRLWDLPAWCVTHQKYHLINSEYGCKRNKWEEMSDCNGR